MKRITSLILTLTLWASLAVSCSAQAVKFIPVHFHNLTGRVVEHSRYDEQINFLNTIYKGQNTPFRFTLSSIDTVPTHIGSARELNVNVEDEIVECFYTCLGKSAFPWDAPFEPKNDDIELTESVLSGPSGASGVVLAHEIGHWLGLYHESFQRVDGVGNCIDVPNLTPFSQKCYYTYEQVYRMRLLHAKFRQ